MRAHGHVVKRPVPGSAIPGPGRFLLPQPDSTGPVTVLPATRTAPVRQPCKHLARRAADLLGAWRNRGRLQSAQQRGEADKIRVVTSSLQRKIPAYVTPVAVEELPVEAILARAGLAERRAWKHRHDVGPRAC